jgi:hypothetical protein
MHNLIWEALEGIASAYIYDVLIYSNLDEEHIEHIGWIMQCLLEAGLRLKPEKC